jgi:hypothetical protein
MTGRAGAGATAFGFDARDRITNRYFHHGGAGIRINAAGFAGMIDKVDFGHDARAAGELDTVVL